LQANTKLHVDLLIGVPCHSTRCAGRRCDCNIARTEDGPQAVE